MVFADLGYYGGYYGDCYRGYCGGCYRDYW